MLGIIINLYTIHRLYSNDLTVDNCRGGYHSTLTHKLPLAITL